MHTIGCCRYICQSNRVRARAARAASGRAHSNRVRGTRREIGDIESCAIRIRINCDARSSRVDNQRVFHDDSVRNGRCSPIQLHCVRPDSHNGQIGWLFWCYIGANQ